MTPIASEARRATVTNTALAMIAERARLRARRQVTSFATQPSISWERIVFRRSYRLPGRPGASSGQADRVAIPEGVRSDGCDRCGPDRLGGEDAAREPANETGVPRSLRPKERLAQTATWRGDPRALPGSDLPPQDLSDAEAATAAGWCSMAPSAPSEIVLPVRGFLAGPAAVRPRTGRPHRVPRPGLDRA